MHTSYGLTGAEKGLKAWSRLEYWSECFDRLLCQEFYLAHSFDLKRFFLGGKGGGSQITTDEIPEL